MEKFGRNKRKKLNRVDIKERFIWKIKNNMESNEEWKLKYEKWG
jgi:hypothetical protein